MMFSGADYCVLQCTVPSRPPWEVTLTIPLEINMKCTMKVFYLSQQLLSITIITNSVTKRVYHVLS